MSKHLKLTISKKPPNNSLIAMKEVNVKKSLFTKLFGGKNKVAILIPGNDVGSIEIVDSNKNEK